MTEARPIVPGCVTSSSDLSADISSAPETADLPALLGAAYRAFEWALETLRGAEDQVGPLLPAFVLAATAAAAAADGRDAVAAAGSFPGPTPRGRGTVRRLPQSTWRIRSQDSALRCLLACATQPPAVGVHLRGGCSARQREAVWLFYFERFKRNEIAAIMQIQRGTAAALLSQARSRLAKLAA